MHKEGLPGAERYTAQGHRRRIWHKIVGSLACVVVFITTYALILPAITLEKESYCGQEEHVHDANCYTQIIQQQTTLACSYETLNVHVHTAACYDAAGNLQCGVADYVLHTHDAGCRDGEGKLICQLPEIAAHVHTDACYEQKQIQTSQPAEGENIEITTTVELTCTQDQLAVTEHIHNENCFVISWTEPELTCQLAEGDEHTHSKLCYGTWEPVCEKQEHTHILSCYADSTADVETAADWEATLANVELTGVWADDVLAIAETQLGYQESTKNYIVLEGGETIKGYTRYGAWYGSPYGDWCAMFVSFCLHYAGVEGIPLDGDCPGWIRVLSGEEYGLYADADAYEPKTGDLIFFDWEHDGVSDHVGLVAEIIGATDTKPAQIKTIGGNSGNRVQYVTYTAGDADIVGYGILPEESKLLMTLELDESGVTYYCNQEEHTHSNENGCYDESGNVTCGLTEHTHTVECLTEQTGEYGGATSYASSFYEGATMIYGSYYDDNYIYYAESEHELDDHDLITFILVPENLLPEGGYDAWEPSTTDWSASTDANYIVVYCSDVDTSTGSDVPYRTYTIDSSRFTSEEQRCVLAGIIGHSYPYISAADMRVQLLADADTDEDLKELSKEILAQCNEHEFIAATQIAIWETTAMGQNMGVISSYYDDNCAGIHDVGWSDAFYAQGSAAEPYVLAIKNWLVRQYEIGDLAVDNDTYEVVYDEESETYSLTVNVTLNRTVRTCETAVYSLRAGSISVDEMTIPTGERAFSATLSGLTRDELTQARVQLSVGGEHMQAYFFDSPANQDFVGGRWEPYADDLSFSVGVETIDISVTKKWAEGAQSKPVSVQLYANGVAYGEAVTLSEENGWMYIWTDMVAKDAEGTDVEYTVEEAPLDGYYSSVEMVRLGATSELLGWQLLEDGAGLENGEEYLLYSNYVNASGIHVSNGALTQRSTGNKLSWNKVDKTDESTTSDGARWVVEMVDGSDSKFYLYNVGYGGYLCYSGLSSTDGLKVYLSSSTTATKAEFTYDSANGYFIYDYEGVNYYLARINSGGYLCALPETTTETEVEVEREDENGNIVVTSQTVTTTEPSQFAIRFDVYKKTTVTLTQNDIEFIVTNATQPGENTVSVAVSKQWAGREDGVYPTQVTVSLMQDGVSYGSSAVLSAANNWSYTWYNLPAVSSSGTDIVYTVLEKVPSGYTAATVVTQNSNSFEIVLTNTWESKTVDFEIRKADSTTGDPLSGAKFNLYRVVLENQSDGTKIGGDPVKLVAEGLTAVDGAATVKDLELNYTYYLVETQAAPGYNTLENPVKFSVDAKGSVTVLDDGDAEAEWAIVPGGTKNTVQVLNKAGYVLPETGGAGTTSYTGAGLSLMMGAVCLMCISSKRRKGAGSA